MQMLFSGIFDCPLIIFIIQLLSVIVEAFTGIDTGFTFIDFLLQQFPHAVFKGTFLLSSRLHLVDVISRFQSDNI